MVTVYIKGQRHQIPDSALIGKGGEADIYLLDKKTVLKRFKEPKDPDYFGNTVAQTGAKQRITEHQTKLPAFPRRLPAAVVAPRELAFYKSDNNRVVGYTMDYLDGMEVLLRLSDRQYRENGGIDGNQVVKIFRNLHQTVDGIHAQGVVIGDFNDLNVMMDAKGDIRIVDADSMQFGTFPCRTFTSRFVDPLRCEPAQLLLARPHNPDSDWYAYAVMLLQSLLYVGPYGGVHRPNTGKRLQHDARVLQRLTVFGPDIIYPKPALPLTVLPDELLEHLHDVFQKDQRGDFPFDLLSNLRWTTCINCGLAHARHVCPECAAPGIVKEAVVIRGTVTARRVFQTTGHLLYVAVQNGTLRYLYHEGASFFREGGHQVLSGQLDPELRFRIQGDKTLLGKRDKLFVLGDGEPAQHATDTFRNLSVFDATDNHRFWIQNGQLVREGRLGSDYIGTVLQGQTLFWAGKRFGFGFYQAGQLMRSFVFNTDGTGINDQVPISGLPGQLLDATCVFSDQYAWFMTSTQEQGKLVHRCHVITQMGEVLAKAEAVQGDDSWLSHSIRGHMAIGSALYVATDEGIVRVGVSNGLIEVERTFPDTEPFVSTATQLVPAPAGIYAVSNQEIVLLEIK